MLREETEMSDVREVEAFLQRGRGLIGLHRKIVCKQMSRDFLHAVQKGLGLTKNEAEEVVSRTFLQIGLRVFTDRGETVGKQFEETVEWSKQGRNIGKIVMLMSIEPKGIRTTMAVTPAEQEQEQETDGDGFGMYEEGGGRK